MAVFASPGWCLLLGRYQFEVPGPGTFAELPGPVFQQSLVLGRRYYQEGWGAAPVVEEGEGPVPSCFSLTCTCLWALSCRPLWL